MPIMKMRVTETKGSITFDGVDKYMIPILLLKYALYKLAYIFGISYAEAYSMWHSNSRGKLLRIINRPLSKEQREGNHVV